MLTGTSPPRRVVAEIIVPDCAAPAPPEELQVTTSITTAFGTTPIQVDLRGNGAGETARIQVEAARLDFADSAPVKTRLYQLACAALKQGGAPAFVADTPLIDQAREWIGQTAPDCQKISAAVHGWNCALPSVEPESARQELAGIRTTMIRRWSRQPYLLARRLALGASLADALSAKNVGEKLDTFCRIVKASLPIELPATLKSKRWQEAVCAKNVPNRIEAATFGLAKTVAEVDFMRELFERTSRLGFLTLRIPPSQTPSRDILVSLTPESDVSDNLIRETTLLAADSEGEESTTEPPHVCWHPVYAEAPKLFELARLVGLAGDAPAVACEEVKPVKGTKVAAERYFAESITSETEFVVTNGRSKTLRLPVGRYNYTLRPLPANPDEWDDASSQQPQTTG